MTILSHVVAYEHRSDRFFSRPPSKERKNTISSLTSSFTSDRETILKKLIEVKQQVEEDHKQYGSSRKSRLADELSLCIDEMVERKLVRPDEVGRSERKEQKI